MWILSTCAWRLAFLDSPRVVLFSCEMSRLSRRRGRVPSSLPHTGRWRGLYIFFSLPGPFCSATRPSFLSYYFLTDEDCTYQTHFEFVDTCLSCKPFLPDRAQLQKQQPPSRQSPPSRQPPPLATTTSLRDNHGLRQKLRRSNTDIRF